MVASFTNKVVTKVYVHLPGTGSGKGAGVSFCDLSRGSDLAASIPVPQHVEMQRNLIKRPRDEDKTNEANKKLRLESTNNANNEVKSIFDENNLLRSENANLQRQVSLSKELFRNPQRLKSVLQRGNISSAIDIAINEMIKAKENHNMPILVAQSEHDLSKLEKDNSQLKSENTSLQKQVSLFMEIFRNPQRLASVLQRLSGKAQMKPVPAA